MYLLYIYVHGMVSAATLPSRGQGSRLQLVTACIFVAHTR